MDKESMAASYVEISFRDQYIGRSDMWRLKMSIIGTALHIGKKVVTPGVRGQVKDIIVNGTSVKCGYVNDSTKTIFRSETAKYFIFIQMSKEMWEFDEDGELFFEKCINGFLPELFSRWKGIGANHVVSIVLFARVRISEIQSPIEGSSADNSTHRDFYRVVVDRETRSDWAQVLVPLKREFIRFQRDVLEQTDASDSGFVSMSYASEGNLLEAINLALNPFDKHYVDRDLMRTGLSIVVVTPGSGFYEVHKKLCRLTWQRMIDNGVGLDLVCLSKPPLHTVPLFQFVSQDVDHYFVKTATNTRNNGNQEGTPSNRISPVSTATEIPTQFSSEFESDRKSNVTNNSGIRSDRYGDTSQTGKSTGSEKLLETMDPLFFDDPISESPVSAYYTIPNWVDCSFWKRKQSQISSVISEPSNNFVTRCRMYEVQMMGFMEQADSKIIMPFLRLFPASQERKLTAEAIQTLELYDADVFAAPLLRRKEGILKAKNFDLDKISGEMLSDDGRQRSLRSKLSPDNNMIVHQPRSHRSRDGHVNASASSETDTDVFGTITSGMDFQNDDLVMAEHVRRAIPTSSRTSANPSPNLRPRSDSDRMLANSYKDTSYLRHHLDLPPAENIPTDGRSKTMTLNDTESYSVSTSLQPIRIRASSTKPADRFMNIQRNSYSESSSFKEGSSPSYDASRIFNKYSPGKSLHHFINRQTYRQNYINPCNPIKNVIKQNSHIRRWEHIFPRMIMSDRDGQTTNWKSLCTPACLPLTTDFFPTPEELSELYQEYTYTVSPADDINPSEDLRQQLTKNVEALLIELISQRLAQGFQLIVATIQDGSHKLPGTPATEAEKARSVKRLDASSVPNIKKQRVVTTGKHIYQATYSFSTTTPYYVSLGDHVHRLFYDSSGNNVEIKRYIRKINYNMDPVSYSCRIWAKNMSGYSEKTIRFTYPSLETYNWNYLDHLISGYQEEMMDALRYWRARFLLIPAEVLSATNVVVNPTNDVLDEEEIRIAGFHKFLDTLEKSRWVPPSERNVAPKQTKRGIEVQMTCLDTSSYVRNEAMKAIDPSVPLASVLQKMGSSMNILSPSSSVPERLSKSSTLHEIALAMQQVSGLSFKDRMWHVKVFKRVCLGSECVDWLIRTFNAIDTREEAVDFGNYLLQKGVLEHIYNRHGFLDGFYFYRIGKDFELDTLKEKSSSWFSSKMTSTVASGAVGKQPSDVQIDSNSKMDGAYRGTYCSLSRQLVVDMDPQRKSTRREMAVLNYDTTYNPKNCYHIQLNWLACTPRLIEDTLYNWTRIADKCSLKLVEAPVEQAQQTSDDYPFQSIISIPLAQHPPTLHQVQDQLNQPELALPSLWFQAELVRSLNFVLDVESDTCFPPEELSHAFRSASYKYTQYIHRSGVAFVQLCDNGEFLWVDNRIYLASSHFGSRGTATIQSPDALRTEFKKVCSDAEHLARFWAEAVDRLKASVVEHA